ncbi:hypothetical protein HYPSUDRAFT_32126 [Hypholoma sublateritium FD-334 SS-4]|uniref:Zona occludens toxin N-terminal domain-containing protein n=1 Tax=Hypholoma sublateritium (strain FD-334 SS-4) TaxID=945553 RepID=A0A0D2N0Y6_HYPSF|nr:hypothetical protein HYPSUDRAFT_32126 [Hypholoma sublateritium FD-334 SS-4]
MSPTTRDIDHDQDDEAMSPSSVNLDHVEWQLLEESDSSDLDDSDPQALIAGHDLATAPLMTRDGFLATANGKHATQYGVLGKVLAIHSPNGKEVLEDKRLYINTNAPFSAIVCGVQGSGKSHTVATILENMLIPKFPAIGTLAKPLVGLVLHYGEGGASCLPSEAAWLSSSISSHVSGVPVCVYVSHSSLHTMKAVYSCFGDAKITVEPLYFKNTELDAAAILSMMAVGSSESAPLYMQIILSILRDLGEKFTFAAFMSQLNISKQKFNPAQLASLEQRMTLLNAFLEPEVSYGLSGQKKRTKRGSLFAPGQLTIVDLSDPFLDEASACGLFEIIVRLFIRADIGTGKVLVVDEAHKYLSCQRTTTGLTKSLLNVIRQQRHLAIRVIISTQEPTVVPSVLLDLCSVTIIHRFSSPTWWQHLIQHVPTDFSGRDVFDQVVKLQTGHAIILAPSGIGLFSEPANLSAESLSSSQDGKVLSRFGRRYLIMKTRKRVTADGGASVLVLED